LATRSYPWLPGTPTSHYGQLYSGIEDYYLKEWITKHVTGNPIYERSDATAG